MQFIDLKSQYQRIESDVKRRIEAVLDSGRYILGPEVGEMEAKLAEYVGVAHCVSCASGTDALIMPLMALGVGPGDAVFVPPFTFMATAEAVALLGATPVFVDVDPVTWNLDADKLGLAIAAVEQNDASIYPLPKVDGRLTPRAIIPVDIFGQPADYEAIGALAREKNLVVIQDAAQSFGGETCGIKACGHGHVGATSFFPAKPLGCYGDGGAIFTDDAEMKKLLLSIRVHGQGDDKYENVRLGLNGRMDTMQAAVILSKLTIFDDELQKRQQVAKAYTERLSGIAGLTPPTVLEGYLSAWAQYCVLAPDTAARTRIMATLKDKGVPTMIYYPKPLHLQKAFGGLGYAAGTMPVSEDAASRIFALPMHPYLDEAAIAEICDQVAAAVG